MRELYIECSDEALVALGEGTPALEQLVLKKCVQLSDGGIEALALGCHSGGAEDEPLPVMRAYGVDVHEAAMGAARRNALLNGCDDSRVVFGYGWELPSRLRAAAVRSPVGPGRRHAGASHAVHWPARARGDA